MGRVEGAGWAGGGRGLGPLLIYLFSVSLSPFSLVWFESDENNENLSIVWHGM